MRIQLKQHQRISIDEEINTLKSTIAVRIMGCILKAYRTILQNNDELVKRK